MLPGDEGPHVLKTAKLDGPAAVAELVDARRSGRRVRKDVEVRLLSAALSKQALRGCAAREWPDTAR